ncbi:hypothetical protein ACM26V_00905 [Salipaludibacillus sp. HK11]|uniref:hypothetical protein n=1 Tax=Salipaludibacillus sp. HK11 TaxID=3394320 RepID=UPI0039FC406C
MEIQGQQVNVQSKTNERPLQMKEGEVYRARIESRISDREAIISVRGQEVKATFEGKVPDRDRVSVQVQERSAEGVRVREIRGESQQRNGGASGREGQSAERVLRDLGHRQPSNELRQATQRMMDRGVPLTRETVNDLNRFLESGRGTESQRTQTVNVMAQKRLEPTGNQIRAVHEALHGTKLSDQVKEIARDVPRTETGREAVPRGERAEQIRTSERAVPTRADISRAIEQIRTDAGSGRDVREQVLQVREQINRLGDREVRRELTEALRSAERGERVESGRETTIRGERPIPVPVRVDSAGREPLLRAVDQVRSALQTGQNLRQSIENVQQVVQRTGDGEARQMVNQSLREMIQVQAQSGREAASGRIQQLSQQLSQTQIGSQQGGNTIQSPSQAQVTQVATSAIVQAWSTAVQDQPNLTTAVEAIRNEMDQHQLSRPVAETLDRALTQAMSQVDSGRELKARQTVMDALSQVEKMVSSSSENPQISQSKAEMQEYVRNEIVQATGLASKNILITEVTERLAQATDEFKAFQRDSSKQLNRIEIMIQQFKQNAVKQTKPMLDNVIKQMDRAIMKSDFMLFADMKTERKLLGASSQLADAKRMLVQGKHSEARQIVRQVQQTMNQMNFQPSNQRVQHVISEEKQWSEPKTPVHRLSQQMEQTSRTMLHQDGSGRQVFEGLRGIGLNRESELAQIFAAGKDMPTEAQQRNLKSILMQMARGEDEGAKGQQQSQQALQNMTGNQLLNRNDTQQSQMHLFQIPLMIKGESENLQVFVNSKNEQESLDWENCNLYFHIDTKSLGPLGITLNVTERSLNVTLKNDTEGFAETVEPLGQKYIDQLHEVGYNVNRLKVAPMTVAKSDSDSNNETEKVDEKEKLAILPIMTEEGFDYKI